MIPSTDSILAAILQVTGIDPRTRPEAVTRARRAAAYSLRRVRGMSYSEIGMALGTSHSTALIDCREAAQTPGIRDASWEARRIVNKGGV